MRVRSKHAERGFTLIEMMVVVTIIGILSSIAIYLTLSLNERGQITAIKSDLSAAYKASIAFYTDHPDQEITPDTLKEYGYRSSRGVQLVVENGFHETFSVAATHPNVSGAYRIDHDGLIITP